MAELHHHGRISFRPDDELCNMQGNTYPRAITLAPGTETTVTNSWRHERPREYGDNHRNGAIGDCSQVKSDRIDRWIKREMVNPSRKRINGKPYKGVTKEK